LWPGIVFEFSEELLGDDETLGGMVEQPVLN